MVDHEFAEYAFDAVSCADGDHGVFLFVALAFSLQRAVLLAHVFDLEVVEFAQSKRHLQYLAGCVGVDVYLDDIRIVGHHDRIAEAHQMIPEHVEIGLLKRGIQVYDKKLRAVTELDALLRHALQFRRGAGRRRLQLCLFGQIRDLIPVERKFKAAVNGQQALAAGINDAGFLEHRQQIGRLGQRALAGLNDRVNKPIDVCTAGGELRSFLRNHAGDGQNRALFRLHDRLVGRFAAHRERA